MKANNKYTRLINNTLLFGISTFSSKVLSLLLTRLYTGYMTKGDYGITNVVMQLANLLIPLVSLGIANAVIRFGLEKGISKTAVYTGGLTAIGIGFAILLLFYPLISHLERIGDYAIFLYAYVLSSCLRTLNHQFVRARMLTRLYAVDGILSTLYTVGFSVLFVAVLEMGVQGYLLSIICADLLSALFLFTVGRIRPFLNFKKLDTKLLKTMLKYSLPLVPASIFWWVTNASDQFFILELLGEESNGIYTVAYKIPTIVTILSTIFTEAWQLSAVTDGQGKGRDKFFSQIYSALMGIAFIAGSFLIFGSKIMLNILTKSGSGYDEALTYIPILILASIFTSLINFQNSVYMLERRSTLSLVTMMSGAATNLALNALLIPRLGLQGAGLATFTSYLVVFIIRGFSTRKYIKVQYKPFKVFINTLVLIVEGYIFTSGQKLAYLWAGILVVIMILLNFKTFYFGIKGFFTQKKRK